MCVTCQQHLISYTIHKQKYKIMSKDQILICVLSVNNILYHILYTDKKTYQNINKEQKTVKTSCVESVLRLLGTLFLGSISYHILFL